MRNSILLILVLFSAPVLSKENCGLESIGLEKSSTVAEKLYYTGTCHYRNKDYELSARSWEELSNLKKVDPEFQGLQVDVLNNLGYLKFFGFGIKQDQKLAVSYWAKAVSLGHYESEYHLCHAYADKEQLTYNLAKAKKHCEKALLIYKGMENPDKDIMSTLKKYNAQVNG
ncbi:sel1 repeat family protein [Microbulbifer sp. ZKSA004]|uniref:sel1 repeat family protein n=1 Tax=Microbulbifer sp. ZKSA004 TaxID=3243389 RepID=UPI00403A30BE